MDSWSWTMQLIFSLAVLAVLSPLTRAIYECKPNSECSCNWGPEGRRDLVCPKFNIQNNDQILKLEVWPKRAYLWCNESRTVQFEWLRDNHVGKIDTFMIHSCPAPNGSFGDLLTVLNVQQLSSLTLQAIKLKSLSRQSLQGLGSIKVLEIDSFGNLTFPDNIFSDMVNLVQLEIRNDPANLSISTFYNLKNLKRLELTNLNLSYLEPGIFEPLTNLKLLNVWGNTLKNITRETFRGLSNLKSLSLNNNAITFLPEDAFAELGKLKNLSITGNNITALPQNLFVATAELEQLKLLSNRKAIAMLPRGLLANLTALKEVYLKDCNISLLPEDMLWNSTNITVLELTTNSIRNLPVLFLKDAKKLKQLDISYNKLESLPDSVFVDLEQLEILRLDYNCLSSLRQSIFQGLLNLKTLSVNNNALQYIDPDTFRSNRNLLEVHMANNHLAFSTASEDYFGKWSPFQHCLGLQVLNLTNNSITEIYADWRNTLNSLYSLDLQHNHIKQLQTEELHFLANNLTVDLRDNQIQTINMLYADLIAIGQEGQYDPKNHTVIIKLDKNPLECDCNIYYLLKYLEHRLRPQVYQLMKLVADDLWCTGPPEKNGTRVKELESRFLTCSKPNGCPAPCSCLFRPEDKATIVDCRDKGLKNIPPAVSNAKELLLDNNFIQHVPSTLRKDYYNISKLTLSHNNVSWLSNDSLPPNLKELYLDHNNLTHLNSSLFEMWANRTNLTLHGNPWICNCDTLDFFNFLQTNFKQVEYLNNITCQDGQSLARMTAKDICPMFNTVVVAISVVTAVVGIVVGLLAAIYFRYQSEVKVWLYAHSMCLWFVTEEELDKDKLYDAFISYSHKDEDFVTNKLLPGLENGPTPFKLCVHYRDWVAGEFITTQIARSVQDSRRTLVVLSPNFIKSEWGRLEFRAAHKQALNEGRTRVIVVIYGELGPLDDLDSELQAYLTTNTYVKWGDPWFWDKLRYALPHPPKVYKSNQTKSQFQNSKDDKIELVNPSTPPAVTTPPADIVNNPLQVSRNGYINHDCDKILVEECVHMNGVVKCV